MWMDTHNEKMGVRVEGSVEEKEEVTVRDKMGKNTKFALTKDDLGLNMVCCWCTVRFSIRLNRRSTVAFSVLRHSPLT